MAIFEDYQTRYKEIVSRMQTLKEFAKTDTQVGKVYAIAAQLVQLKGSAQNIQWLMDAMLELVGYFGYIDGRGNQAWAEYKLAEVCFKQVRDGLLLAIRGDRASITEARAEADRETVNVQVDVIAKEKRSRDYETAAKFCSYIITVIQSRVSFAKSERFHSNLPDQQNKT